MEKLIVFFKVNMFFLIDMVRNPHTTYYYYHYLNEKHILFDHCIVVFIEIPMRDFVGDDVNQRTITSEKSRRYLFFFFSLFYLFSFPILFFSTFFFLAFSFLLACLLAFFLIFFLFSFSFFPQSQSRSLTSFNFLPIYLSLSTVYLFLHLFYFVFCFCMEYFFMVYFFEISQLRTTKTFNKRYSCTSQIKLKGLALF